MTVLRREEELSTVANPETEISCRIVFSPISPFVPVLVRHLSLSNSLPGYETWAAAGYRTAHKNPTSSRATAVTTLPCGLFWWTIRQYLR